MDDLIKKIEHISAQVEYVASRIQHVEKKVDEIINSCGKRMERCVKEYTAINGRITAIEAIERYLESQALRQQAISTKQIVYVTLIAGGVSGIANLIGALLK